MKINELHLWLKSTSTGLSVLGRGSINEERAELPDIPFSIRWNDATKMCDSLG